MFIRAKHLKVIDGISHIIQLAYSPGVARNVIYVGALIVTSKTYELSGHKIPHKNQLFFLITPKNSQTCVAGF